MSPMEDYAGRSPQVAPTAFVAAGAQLIGDVRVDDYCSIWFQCVLRGDLHLVEIGHHTNIQDGSVCHVDDDCPCTVGHYTTIGHRAILHGCSVGNEVLIGMGATLMNGVVVGDRSIVGAAALLTEGLHVPPGSLVYGAPARVVSQLDVHEKVRIRSLAERYCDLAEIYRRHPR